MSVAIVVVCHTPIETLFHSIGKFIQTAGETHHQFIFVNNHWPLEKPRDYANAVAKVAKTVNGLVVTPDRNIGGTQGFNFALDYLDPHPEDLILGYDPDSNPTQKGWLSAMIKVMKADRKLATIGLWPHCEINHDFSEEMIAGEKVRFFPHAEMFSVTMWRRQFIGRGIEGHFQYYGQIEIPTWERAQKQGMRLGYLSEFKEAPCPIPHPPIYSKWKYLHVQNIYSENFDQYVAEKKTPE